MAQTSRDIQRRLKSVRNIKKITRAMELVAASKMRKSVTRVLASRPYADAAWYVAMNMVPTVDTSSHPLLEERPVKRACVVVVSSNRGLCGAYNMNVVQKALELIVKEKWGQGVEIDFITFGKIGAKILLSAGKHIVSDYPKSDISASIAEILPISREIIGGFISKKYDEVCIAYTDYHSSLKQVPHIRHILPLVKPSRYLGRVREERIAEEPVMDVSEFLFEPSRNEVLDRLLPRLIELQVFQTVLESEASEHSARMMAMQSATDAAGDMMDALILAYNQARQASITAELAEITIAGQAIQ